MNLYVVNVFSKNTTMHLVRNISIATLKPNLEKAPITWLTNNVVLNCKFLINYDNYDTWNKFFNKLSIHR